MHHGDFLAAVGNGVVERELEDVAAALTGIDAGGHAHRMGVAIDGYVMLVTHVEAFDVLAAQNQVDVFETPARHQRLCRPQVGIELELFPQTHIGRAIAAARWGFQWSLERKSGALDRVQRDLRQRIAKGRDTG